jgi:hypothetical protein
MSLAAWLKASPKSGCAPGAAMPDRGVPVCADAAGPGAGRMWSKAVCMV